MKTPKIMVNRSFSEITPESSERGDFSDSGMIAENEALTFGELVLLMEREGFAREGVTDWLSTGYAVTNYRTGTEREETLHFSHENPPRMKKWFELALRFVNARRARRQALTLFTFPL